MHIALRDAPLGGQGGAHPDFDDEDANNRAADPAGARGHEHQRATDDPKTCGEVTP